MQNKFDSYGFVHLKNQIGLVFDTSILNSHIGWIYVFGYSKKAIFQITESDFLNKLQHESNFKMKFDAVS